ncbi:MAG: hypothetical protein ACOC11_02125 [Prolixibacteraceae bacterium]
MDENLAKKIVFIVVFLFVPVAMLNATIVVLNGLTHENQVQPGESYRGVIEVQNTGNTEKGVRVYLRDYWFSYQGESRHDPGGTLARSNANWINYNPELLNLGPGEKATIDFEVQTPENDSLQGTYWSVIMIEGVTKPDTTRRAGVTINTAIRYAVQIVTNIGNSGTRDIQFLGLDIARENEVNLLNVYIENTGEWLLRPELALELFDDAGNSAGVVKANPRKVYPGTSVEISLDLEGIKPGDYSGVLVADCDEDHIFGTNVSFEIM